MAQREGLEMAPDAAEAWPDRIYDLLKEHDIRQVALVPDAGHSRLIRRCQADNGMRVVTLTTEEEGIAQLFGAWLGGQKCVPAVLEAMGTLVWRADRPEDVAPTVEATLRLAFNTFRPTATLIGQRVIGAKTFGK